MHRHCAPEEAAVSRGVVSGNSAIGAALGTVFCGLLAVWLLGDARAFGVVIVIAGALASWAIARNEHASPMPDRHER